MTRNSKLSIVLLMTISVLITYYATQPMVVNIFKGVFFISVAIMVWDAFRKK
ncbi:hypothetical protein LC048_19705 [Mesobacillus subterraneus]|uniref:hypothetical protein n=1 Tax=Mesobacillus subterraneus TaxID=285983 RepID=UPI001CFEDE20|nr:hypothetical protein [Mesobacillus subterraneus]WLR54620.1 hypothetical protein LC048_19705 [Mesobacillus subterraneus]